MREAEPRSNQVIKQRVRNRIIEYLELASSPDAQRRYEHSVPIAQVPAEMIEMWSDVVHASDLQLYSMPVFALEEQAALADFQSVWEHAVAETPNEMPHTIEALLETPEWGRLMSGAKAASAVFAKRGRFSEDEEDTFNPVSGEREFDASDLWQMRWLDATHDYIKEIAELNDSNPFPEYPLLPQVMNSLMTELWDRGFSQTAIREAFEAAVADMPRYAAGEEVRK